MLISFYIQGKVHIPHLAFLADRNLTLVHSYCFNFYSLSPWTLHISQNGSIICNQVLVYAEDERVEVSISVSPFLQLLKSPKHQPKLSGIITNNQVLYKRISMVCDTYFFISLSSCCLPLLLIRIYIYNHQQFFSVVLIWAWPFLFSCCIIALGNLLFNTYFNKLIRQTFFFSLLWVHLTSAAVTVRMKRDEKETNFTTIFPGERSQ